jgi:glucose-6-phosphate isomerase
MLPKINFTETEAYKYLADHFIDINQKSIKDLFAEDADRFNKFSVFLRIFYWTTAKTVSAMKH